jgi:nucleoid-associated protein YgaU
MGLYSFIKDKLGFGGPDPEKIAAHIKELGLQVQNFGVTITDGTATVTGLAVNRAEASKIVMAVGNTEGVTAVDNKMRVPLSSIQPPTPAAPAPVEGEDESDEVGVVFYQVVRGDTLSAIAKKHYGNANLYPQIFEANRPMLSHPDKIYPGQVLRIPPK